MVLAMTAKQKLLQHRDFLWWLYAEAAWKRDEAERERDVARVAAGSAYQRADEQTKAAIDWEKRYHATRADLEGARAQLGKTDELHEAQMAELIRERDEAPPAVHDDPECRAAFLLLRNLVAERTQERDLWKSNWECAQQGNVMLLKKAGELIASLAEEVAWQRDKYGDGHDKSALGRLIGMEDALHTVRKAFNAAEAGRPAAQDAHEHEWKRCPDCPVGDDQPCACAGAPCCDAERRENSAEQEAPAPLDGRLTDADDYGRDYEAQAAAMGVPLPDSPVAQEAGEPPTIGDSVEARGTFDGKVIYGVLIDTPANADPDESYVRTDDGDERFVLTFSVRPWPERETRAVGSRTEAGVPSGGDPDHG